MIETSFVIVENQNIFTGMNHFLHDKILRSSIKLIFSSDNCLQKPQILHMSAMGFNAIDKMVDDFFIDFVAECGIALRLQGNLEVEGMNYFGIWWRVTEVCIRKS